MKRVDWKNEKDTIKRFNKIYDILVKMEERLKVIEKSVKKDDTKKQLLND